MYCFRKLNFLFLLMFTDHSESNGNRASSSSALPASSFLTPGDKDHQQNQQFPTHYTVTASLSTSEGVAEHEFQGPKVEPLQQQQDDVDSEDDDDDQDGSMSSLGHDYQSDQYHPYHEQRDGPNSSGRSKHKTKSRFFSNSKYIKQPITYYVAISLSITDGAL